MIQGLEIYNYLKCYENEEVKKLIGKSLEEIKHMKLDQLQDAIFFARLDSKKTKKEINLLIELQKILDRSY